MSCYPLLVCSPLLEAARVLGFARKTRRDPAGSKLAFSTARANQTRPAQCCRLLLNLLNAPTKDPRFGKPLSVGRRTPPRSARFRAPAIKNAPAVRVRIAWWVSKQLQLATLNLNLAALAAFSGVAAKRRPAAPRTFTRENLASARRELHPFVSLRH
jgi:hypothetical protein